MNRIRAFLRSRRPNGHDGGYSTETVVVIAALVGMAIGVVGIIAGNVEAAASAISFSVGGE
ncbi:hypothetical protein [Actinorugispora endophytica]|uniref:Flp pilus assembly pilin Flp n=1 Tax=Actinorugispora endophytica TaxID=1605990 RepID=A0A4V3D984_9ACTN|nr:hypothetical protein [Actinorugispora endophytica]TDQ55100.1 hypothetical protein EV190_101423 [Actinorugispora endophytica]